MNEYQVKVSIVYLTYQALDIVRETLPPLVERIKDLAAPAELIVVDNGSDDGSTDFIKQFPVKRLFHKKNLGFAAGCNSGAAIASGEYIFFINNDIKVKGDFLSPLLKIFSEKKDVFAVGPKFLRWDEKTLDDAARNPFYERGLLDVKLQEDNLDKIQPMVFFLGGGFLVRRETFFEFGCFDEIYTPFSWEDLDLGYRAIKRGYVNYYCPDVILFHKREATTKVKFSDQYFKSTVWRNKFIFMWSNLTNPEIFRDHLIQLPLKLLKFLFNGRWPYVWGFMRALIILPQIIRKRRAEISFNKINDKKILDGLWKNGI